MERLENVGNQGHVGRFRPEQIAQQSTWGVVPNEQMTMMAMHNINMVPGNGSTVTTVNPLDAGDQFYYEHSDCGCEHTLPAGRRL